MQYQFPHSCYQTIVLPEKKKKISCFVPHCEEVRNRAKRWRVKVVDKETTEWERTRITQKKWRNRKKALKIPKEKPPKKVKPSKPPKRKHFDWLVPGEIPPVIKPMEDLSLVKSHHKI